MKKETNLTKSVTSGTRGFPFAYIADQWLADKKKEVKESSFYQYYRIVHRIIKPRWEALYIDEIDERTLTGFGEDLFAKYKVKTARSIIVTVNQILEYSYKRGYIPYRQKVSSKAKNGKISHPQVFTNSEQVILTAYLLDKCDLKKLGVLICLYSGLRLGEICGLRWSDVDLRNGILKVQRTIQRISDGTGNTYFSIGPPKSEHSEREVPIPSFLQVLLSKECTANDYYVTTGLPEFTQPRTYQNNLKRYFRECELPNYHFHSLRHTFASRAIELGFDPKTLSEILGHANVKITVNVRNPHTNKM